MAEHHALANHGDIPQMDWGSLLIQNQSWLRGVILARTGEPQAVDEVWQELSLAAVAAPRIESTKASAWLYRVAVIRSIRHRRQQARQQQVKQIQMELESLASEFQESANKAATPNEKK